MQPQSLASHPELNEFRAQKGSARKGVETAFVIAVVALCIAVAVISVRRGAARLFSINSVISRSVASANLALELAPSDPEVRYLRSGLLASVGDTQAAIDEALNALELRPGDYFLWLHLGSLRESIGDLPGAEAAFRKATDLAPHYVQPHWRLGNLLFRCGRIDSAFGEFRAAAANDWSLYGAIAEMAWVVAPGKPDEIKHLVGNEDSAARFERLCLLARHWLGREAVREYEEVKGLTDPQRDKFIALLVETGNIEDGFAIWRSAQGNMVPDGLVDGGFDRSFVIPAPVFGWKSKSADNFTVSCRKSGAESHGLTARIDWRGEVDSDKLIIWQLVPVQPDTQYLINFEAATDDLYSYAMPVVVVRDNSSEAVLGMTQITERTSGWNRYQLSFRTGSNNHGVKIGITRVSCSFSPCPIFGRLEVDNFSLERAA